MSKQRIIDGIIIVGAAVGLVLFLRGHRHQTGSGPVAPAVDCRGKTGQTIQLELNDRGFSSSTIAAKACDSLVLTITGNRVHWPTGGTPTTANPFPEFDSKKVLQAGDRFQVQFTRTGTIPFHDHLHTENTGQLTIAP